MSGASEPQARFKISHAKRSYNANNSYLDTVLVRLSELALGAGATVHEVEDAKPGDAIARRLRDLGFVRGEPVRVVAQGPVGAEPLLIQIGYTRFALRRAEAARIRVQPDAA